MDPALGRWRSALQTSSESIRRARLAHEQKRKDIKKLAVEYCVREPPGIPATVGMFALNSLA